MNQLEQDQQESKKIYWCYEPEVFRTTFVSPWKQYEDRVGQSFAVLRPLTVNEIDLEEVGPMFRIRFEDGFETDAWPEEVCVGIPDPRNETAAI